MKKIFCLKKAVLAFLASVLFASCASVSRVSSDTTMDLSGYWNDTDVRIVAESLIRDCITSKAISAYPGGHNEKLPVVIVGTFKNASDEHIDTSILTKKLEVALLNSGAAEFVANSSERGEVRQERNEQQFNASEESAKAIGNETGADFMLQGAVKTIVDSNGGKSTRTYFVSAELIDIETNKKLWIGENSEIKKVIKGSSVRL